jgi:hypothetical protein
MKKVLVIIALFLLAIPLTVNAALAGEVETITVKENGSKVEFSGTTDDNPIFAVMCKLFEEDKEVDKISVEVSDKKYEGEFTKVPNGTYKVSCANYGGGTFKSETIEVTKSDVKKESPKTGDNMYVYCIVLALCVAAFVLAGMYPRFLKKIKKNSSTKKKTTNKK